MLKQENEELDMEISMKEEILKDIDRQKKELSEYVDIRERLAKESEGLKNQYFNAEEMELMKQIKSEKDSNTEFFIFIHRLKKEILEKEKSLKFYAARFLEITESCPIPDAKRPKKETQKEEKNDGNENNEKNYENENVMFESLLVKIEDARDKVREMNLTRLFKKAASEHLERCIACEIFQIEELETTAAAAEKPDLNTQLEMAKSKGERLVHEQNELCKRSNCLSSAIFNMADTCKM
jgi:hypothetical protein